MTLTVITITCTESQVGLHASMEIRVFYLQSTYRPKKNILPKLKQDTDNWCAPLFPRLSKAFFSLLESTHQTPNEAQLWLWWHSGM